MTQYLSLGDVIAIHDYTMRRLGSAPAVLRDEGALESAIRRPRTAVYYADTDLIRQAVLLAVGISQARAFLDGNKRTAVQVMDTFLVLNGMAYNGDPLAFAKRLEDVAKRSFELDAVSDDLEAWLRDQVVSLA